MPMKLCSCGQFEIEIIDQVCQQCSEKPTAGWMSMLQKTSPYAAAIIAARSSVEDFDNLESGWGL